VTEGDALAMTGGELFAVTDGDGLGLAGDDGCTVTSGELSSGAGDPPGKDICPAPKMASPASLGALAVEYLMMKPCSGPSSTLLIVIAAAETAAV
jgi:hypothetical protein